MNSLIQTCLLIVVCQTGRPNQRCYTCSGIICRPAARTFTYNRRCHPPLALMLNVISILLFLIILTVPIILITLILTHIMLMNPMYSIYHWGRS